jgi:hypothetical protein
MPGIAAHDNRLVRRELLEILFPGNLLPWYVAFTGSYVLFPRFEP